MKRKGKIKREKTEKQKDIERRYRKERNRIISYRSKMKKAGYDVSQFKLPDIPKTIKESSVNRLKKITPDVIRKKIYYINEYTGEFSRASNRTRVRRLKKERKEQLEEEKKIIDVIHPGGEKENGDIWHKIADKIIGAFKREISYISSERGQDFMRRWLDSWIGSFGRLNVALSLEKSAREGHKLNIQEDDSEETVKRKVNDFVEVIMESTGEYSSSYINYILEDY